jgi:hypothetical protein
MDREGHKTCKGWTSLFIEKFWSVGSQNSGVPGSIRLRIRRKRMRGWSQGRCRLVTSPMRPPPRGYRPPAAGNTKAGSERTRVWHKPYKPRVCWAARTFGYVKLDYPSATKPADVGGDTARSAYGIQSRRGNGAAFGGKAPRVNPMSASGMR